MRVLGLPIPFTGERKKDLSPVNQNRGGWFRVLESFAGAWQQNVEVDFNSVLSFHADFACRTLIASDISKLRVKLVKKDKDGIWEEVNSPAYSPVLRKPNDFQNRIQFFESWVLSKLQRGNTYVLKQRNNAGVVAKLYVLDPSRVRPLVADDGSIFYELQADNLSGLTGPLIVPAREIIHDRFNCMFHPLVGMSPIYASGLAAMQGLSIQNDSTKFFQNGARPGGVLTAPAAISDDTAARLKEYWDNNFTGANAGKVAVLGDGLKYEAMRENASDAQLIEQLKWSAEVVCSTYHVPPYKVGVGAMPSYNNVQALNTEYYSQCLQKLIEDIELCLDEGLGLSSEKIGTEFDLDGLLRMDSVTLMQMLKEGISAGVLSPNEARRRIDLKKVTGGDTPYLQQQNYSLEALAKRDAQADPFGQMPAPQPEAIPAPEDDSEVMESEARAALVELYKGLR
ncbi:phage portal protein [Nitratireductor basaltis]|uniref:Phage portal protein, HK97 family n=1 Tax=Nitratireductor basaltis TaxID=472175 RepID=A0A084UBK6_9HYPH|nr:phage portal protein [Nitratireductor basaltis]KFB10342.1 Phage portal protein, HK97 family [Nitratireductor basaltis]